MNQIDKLEWSHDVYCDCAKCQKRLQDTIESTIANETWGITVTRTTKNQFPNEFSARTFGLKEKYDHNDIQICLPMQERRLLGIFVAVVSVIERGTKLEPGKRYFGIIDEDITIQCIASIFKGTELLRICIPTTNNDFEYPAYKAQFTKLECK